MNQKRFKNHAFMKVCLILITSLLFSCYTAEESNSNMGEIKVVFHDTLMNSDSIKRIDITVVETQIIDIYDNKKVISTEKLTFNLLELTKNNPVVLAHTMIAAGTYRQIRLILDSNSTITLNDNTVHSLKVPSGEQTGIKIDGVFDIPSGKLYTLDIDLDPNKSIHYNKGQGYMLKPVITLAGSEVNSGNFFYEGNYAKQPFVLKINPDASIEVIDSRYPQYIIKGTYTFNGLEQKLVINPSDVVCPSCTWWQNVTMNMFKKIPEAQTYDMLSFGADFIRVRDSSSNELKLVRVDSFNLSNSIETKNFILTTTLTDTSLIGKTMVAQIDPIEGQGRSFCVINTIPNDLTVGFQFAIPLSEFDDIEKKYILIMGITDSADNISLSSTGRVSGMENIISHNLHNRVQLNISKVSNTNEPIQVDVPYNTDSPE